MYKEIVLDVIESIHPCPLIKRKKLTVAIDPFQ
jgi:hypothetical protein